jgi:signal transduction histidine kinase
VIIEFNDTGRGIAPEHLERVFDPFFTTKLGAGGSGLGLNLVNNIVTGVLGGTVSIDSVVGRGTCLTVDIPRVAPREVRGRASEHVA